MAVADSEPSTNYQNFLQVIKKRRSVRRFEKGKKVDRETLLKIAEAGRWAPTGANAQCWDLIVVDDADTRQAVLDVFLRQSQRLVDHAKGFPAVKKTYLANTVAIFVVLGDPHFKVCFPQGTSPEWQREYSENNERIFLASLGAAIQNIQLAVTACGLTSAWLSGGGEDKTNEELADVLGYPRFLSAIGTIPVGYPEKDVSRRYRRPLEKIVRWNRYDAAKLRPDAMIGHYVADVRPFAMYRGMEDVGEWEDADEILGRWKDFYICRLNAIITRMPANRLIRSSRRRASPASPAPRAATIGQPAATGPQTQEIRAAFPRARTSPNPIDF